MAYQNILVISLLAHVVSAHFQINYPLWRGDSFLAPGSQYVYPCANVNQSTDGSNNRTLWPLTGGSLDIDFHHPFTYVFVNLGLGSTPSVFNISLNPAGMPLNETGNGTLCMPTLALPSGLEVTEGMNASIQVSTVGPEGTALYNCADITFSGNATVLPTEQCVNDTGVSIASLGQEVNDSTTTTGAGGSSSSASAAPASSSSSSMKSEGVRVLGDSCRSWISLGAASMLAIGILV